VALAEKVKTTMADLARSFPKSMRYDISLDTTLPLRPASMKSSKPCSSPWRW
jgi:multidrug efflux pump subunit AcrB